MSEPMEPDKIRAIVEAILMTADAPVSPGKLTSLIKGVNGRDIRRAIDELNDQYQTHGHAMSIVEVAGGFQVATRRDYGPWVRKFHDRGYVRLSQAGLETLAIVAFKQPITRMEIDSIRGVDSGGVIRTLLEVNMIRIVGRSEGVGRPMLFGTTRDFMTHFGLKSLADLPKPKELEELLAEGERKARAGREEGTEAPADAGAGEAGEPGDGEPSASEADGSEADGAGPEGASPEGEPEAAGEDGLESAADDDILGPASDASDEGDPVDGPDEDLSAEDGPVGDDGDGSVEDAQDAGDESDEDDSAEDDGDDDEPPADG